ncbi:MAG: 1-deoxy-D-xylulose-5-phosphate reductoisomerase [Thermodesulfobacteria bacterium]|nr:1-deoxy-D-xylulose-5-phosphate reductoisomerase [Thermodesulfobacteriota bacterium]
MKGIGIFGATGSIGKSALDILKRHKSRFRPVVLTCKKNISELLKFAEEFKVPYLVVETEEHARRLKDQLSYSARVLWGDEGLKECAMLEEVDTLVVGISGIKGIIPAYYGLKTGKRVAIANKESIIAGGKFLKLAQEEGKGFLIPVDSEHSSIFQLLEGRQHEVLEIILTASGGPFYKLPLEKFDEITPEQAIAHPNWKMGAKISVDSATLMNKGFEVIEACFLFNMPPEKVKVVIHPQSLVHGIVKMKDGSYFFHMSYPDMRLPIAYALFYPERPSDIGVKEVDLVEIGKLIFEAPDLKKFPCLKLAYEVIKKGGIYPLILEAGDEVVVDAFLSRKISFKEIPEYLQKLIENFKPVKCELESIEELLSLHKEVVNFTWNLIERSRN